MRRALLIFAKLLAVIALIFLVGPRTPTDTTITFDPLSIGPDPDAYLAAAEAKVDNIRPGQGKQIVWADPAAKAKTPLALVYVHGFSASSGEVRPLPDLVAKAMGANLFYTRLTGHGQDQAAMGTASVNAWVNDYEEALAIGRAIGERVVVIATSTGASLATWRGAQEPAPQGVAGYVFISPNYGIQAAGSFLLTAPWSRQLAELIVGRERSFPPLNEMQAQLWTTRYPTTALLPMAALVKLAASAAVETVTSPALFIFSDADAVVRPETTRKIAARWGGPHELLTVTESGDPYMHVITGDALSPTTTAQLAERTTAWIKANVQ